MDHDGGEKKPPGEPDEAGGRGPRRKQRAAHRRRLAPRLFLAYARTRAVEKFAVPDSSSDSPPQGHQDRREGRLRPRRGDQERPSRAPRSSARRSLRCARPATSALGPCARASRVKSIGGSRFRVEAFSPKSFASALGRDEHDQFDRRRPLSEEVSGHIQAGNLYGHLESLTVRTIVVESTYVDGGFLMDYTSFYATVFARFDRFCRRLHFFTSDFDEAEFRGYLLLPGGTAHPSLKSFSGSYAGFIVARPLPKAIIGRTVVRALPTQTDEGKRRYLAVVDTPVNLFCLRLTVEKSLPFQQQDRAVSACATVALWSAFFRTAAMFGTPVARPAAITQAATTSLAQDRALLSTGLTLEQICDAIHGNGLDPEVFALGESHNIPVLSLIRAYLEAGLPVILGVKNGESRHAVTAVGYRLSRSPAIARELIPRFHDTPSVARSIDMLFCHDDNVAPFAEFGIRGDPAGGHIRLTSDAYGKLQNAPDGGASADGVDEAPTTVIAGEFELEYVVVPCNQSVRLKFDAV